MRRFLDGLAAGLSLFALAASGHAASLPGAWQHEQQFQVSAPGLTRISLPVQTIDQARPGLEDLRLYDDSGREVPFVTERPRPAPRLIRAAKSFQAALNPNNTVVTMETGLAQPLESVTLESPAPEFIKSVQVSGSTDGKSWQSLAQGRPIFRQRYGAGQLGVALPQIGEWRWLRLTIDDRRSPPVPFSGAQVHAAAPEPAAKETLPAAIHERHENPGETRISLNLGAASLDVSSVALETSEPLFMRQVTVAVPQITENTIREQTIARGTVYRVAVEEQPLSEYLSVPVENQVRSRELVLLIRNQDSPPLNISRVRVERRPVYLVFHAQQPGAYHLLSGNRRCAAPAYDLAALGMNLRRTPVRDLEFSPLADNPGYREPEVLPGVGAEGSKLDVAAWRYRKAVKPKDTGVQQIEFDLDVMAHGARGFGDLRVLRADTQVPFILEHTSISRSLAPEVTLTNEPRQPNLSRWMLKLPRKGLPVDRLRCAADSPLFRREVTLWEEATGDRGETFRRHLGSAVWLRTPDQTSGDFFLTLQQPPTSDTLLLETHNGDNPPVQLKGFQFFYPATRMLFKGKSGDELLLYYGNPQTGPPDYDLSLVAGQLLAADKLAPALGGEEQLKKSPWGDRQPGKGGVVFWGMLALVVIVLLVVIARLLPKSAA